MARISGVNIPLNKRVEIGLTYIYGVGHSTSKDLLAQASIDPDTYVRDLTEDEISKLRDLVDEFEQVNGQELARSSPDPGRLREIEVPFSFATMAAS